MLNPVQGSDVRVINVNCQKNQVAACLLKEISVHNGDVLRTPLTFSSHWTFSPNPTMAWSFSQANDDDDWNQDASKCGKHCVVLRLASTASSYKSTCSGVTITLGGSYFKVTMDGSCLDPADGAGCTPLFGRTHGLCGMVRDDGTTAAGQWHRIAHHDQAPHDYFPWPVQFEFGDNCVVGSWTDYTDLLDVDYADQTGYEYGPLRVPVDNSNDMARYFLNALDGSPLRCGALSLPFQGAQP